MTALPLARRSGHTLEMTSSGGIHRFGSSRFRIRSRYVGVDLGVTRIGEGRLMLVTCMPSPPHFCGLTGCLYEARQAYLSVERGPMTSFGQIPVRMSQVEMLAPLRLLLLRNPARAIE